MDMPRKKYTRPPKRDLESKIQQYVGMLDDGWGLDYSRVHAGLRTRSRDFLRAQEDARVIAAQNRHLRRKLEKPRGFA